MIGRVPPRTRYARNGEVNVAYQVVGDGPIDLLFVPGFVSNLDAAWAVPQIGAMFRSLARFSRLIIHDKRGTGLSDPVVGVATLEQRMEDIHAVLDAVGSERAALFGISEGGPASLLFAATYPQRTAALVIYGSFARGTPGEDEQDRGSLGDDALGKLTDIVSNHWGDGRTLDLFTPSLAARGERERESRALFERASASPALAAAVLQAVREVDVTEALGAVRVPTLVLHRTGDVIPIDGGRYIAERVAGARMIELAGDDHAPWFDGEQIVREIERFLTGTGEAPTPDRLLATVLFTDIVDSTRMAGELGDARWREVLAAHDAIVRDHLGAYGGREVKHTGDGFLATFDGPARAVRCACAARDEVAERTDLAIRAGLHTGECEVVGEDVAGMAIHIGARVAAEAGPGEVLVSGTVRDLVVGSEIAFEDRGSRPLKGVPGEWRLLRVRDSAEDSKVGTPTEPEPVGARERAFLATARRAPWLAQLPYRRELRQRRREAARAGAAGRA